MTLRSWATPLTIGAFLLISVTGVLMFFHLNTTLGKVAHEWLGWFLLIGVGAHLLLNWRALTTYFKRPAANAIMGAFVVVLLASFVPLSGTSGELPVREIIGRLNEAPIATLAVLAGKDAAAVLQTVQATYPDAAAHQTVTDLAGDDMAAGSALLTAIFATPASE